MIFVCEYDTIKNMVFLDLDYLCEVAHMDKDAREAKKMTKELPFKERLSNFWYYKKWWVISAVAAVIVIAITIYEITAMPSYDLVVGYYSESGISEESVDKLKSELAQYATDINDDGRIIISLTPIQAVIDMGGDDYVAAETRLMSELESSDTMLFICDRAYRDMLMSGDNAECFEEEFNMADRPELKEIIGYPDDTLYVLRRTLYPREENDSNKRLEHNNAATVFEGIRENRRD